MAEEGKKVNKQSKKPTKAAEKEISINELSERLSITNELFTDVTAKLDSLITEVKFTNHVGRIMIELLVVFLTERKWKENWIANKVYGFYKMCLLVKVNERKLKKL